MIDITKANDECERDAKRRRFVLSIGYIKYHISRKEAEQLKRKLIKLLGAKR